MRTRVWLLLVLVMVTAGGCASLAQFPFQLIKLPFTMVGWIFELLQKAPMPPPWVFF